MLGGQNQIHIEYVKTSDISGVGGLNLGESECKSQIRTLLLLKIAS